MDRREFLKTCWIVLAGSLLPKTVLWDARQTVKEKFEKAITWIEENETVKNEVFTKRIAEMKWTPLEMNWIAYRDSLRQFLWLNQFKTIFEKYNPDIVKYKKDGKINDNKNGYINNELVIPRIYDELTQYFSENLETFIEENSKQRLNIWEDKTFIIVKKVWNWKFALAYYKDSKLFIATHVSPWKISKPFKKKKRDKKTWDIKTITVPWWSNSPTWVYRVNKSDYFKYKKSRKFELSPMPYAIQIHDWVFFHHWQDVDWYKKSHWCIRVPWFYQECIYNNIKSWTKIIIDWTKDDVD